MVHVLRLNTKKKYDNLKIYQNSFESNDWINAVTSKSCQFYVVFKFDTKHSSIIDSKIAKKKHEIE